MACCLLVAGTALETSLVEWKQLQNREMSFCPKTLGNFLSGMETFYNSNLGETAPSLETSLVEWKLPHGAKYPELPRPWKLP